MKIIIQFSLRGQGGMEVGIQRLVIKINVCKEKADVGSSVKSNRKKNGCDIHVFM